MRTCLLQGLGWMLAVTTFWGAGTIAGGQEAAMVPAGFRTKSHAGSATSRRCPQL